LSLRLPFGQLDSSGDFGAVGGVDVGGVVTVAHYGDSLLLVVVFVFGRLRV